MGARQDIATVPGNSAKSSASIAANSRRYSTSTVSCGRHQPAPATYCHLLSNDLGRHSSRVMRGRRSPWPTAISRYSSRPESHLWCRIGEFICCFCRQNQLTFLLPSCRDPIPNGKESEAGLLRVGQQELLRPRTNSPGGCGGCNVTMKACSNSGACWPSA